jgi:hypothetical protein
MINNILKSVSFIFHPLVIPLVGALLYFSKSPRYIPEETIYAKLIALCILTVVLPILLFLLLKTLGKVNSIYLATSNERIVPLILNSIITLLIVLRVLPSNEIIELYYFFIAILISTLSCLILAIFKIKASIHMMAIAGLFMYAVALSIHFSININGTIALISILIGAIATSRLHLNAHTFVELIVGFGIGFLPQLIMVNYWL